MKYVNYTHPTLGEMKVPIDPPLRENMGGLIKMRASDFIVGANSPLAYEVIRYDADWRGLIFSPDKQFYPDFDSFACTNFAASNSRKLQLKQATGIEFDISERAMAKLSGTIPGFGNYMTADSDWVRKNGLILNKFWPNDEGSLLENWTKAVPLAVQKEAMKVKEQYEWIDSYTASLQYHLKQCPLTIMVKAGNTNHDICVVYVDHNGIWYLDSYPHNSEQNYLAITTQVPINTLKIITKPMNNIYFVHIKDTQEYGLLSVSSIGKYYVPASTEGDLKIRGGSLIPLTPDGKVDFSQARDIVLPLA